MQSHSSDGLGNHRTIQPIIVDESTLSLRPPDLDASLCPGLPWMHFYPVNELMFERSASALIDIPSDYAHLFRQLAWECLHYPMP
jgi:hypothetical protein